MQTYFYPRPPRGGRRRGFHGRVKESSISIHALREEGDLCPPMALQATSLYFYPRPPRGGRRVNDRNFCGGTGISIHALREEGDPLPYVKSVSNVSISIHALREEGDRSIGVSEFLGFKFLSTPSARRATCASSALAFMLHIFLSTPSARRATAGALVPGPRYSHFYPRPPRGGRQQKQRQNLYFQTNYTTFCTNLEEP